MCEQWYCIAPLLFFSFLPFMLLAENNMPSSWRLCDWLRAKHQMSLLRRMQLNELGRTGFCRATPVVKKAQSDVEQMD